MLGIRHSDLRRRCGLLLKMLVLLMYVTRSKSVKEKMVTRKADAVISEGFYWILTLLPQQATQGNGRLQNAHPLPHYLP